MDGKKDIFGLMNMFIIVSGGVGAFLYLSDGINNVATKEFHEQDLEEKHLKIEEGINKVRLNTLPPRIRPILDAKEAACIKGEEFSPEVDMILQGLLHDYKELAGREWQTGKCNNGNWIE
jgi:hypothetical protein